MRGLAEGRGVPYPVERGSGRVLLPRGKHGGTIEFVN